MADFKWYEQRSVVWANAESLAEPLDSHVGALLAELAADGWEDDPTAENGNGWVNVRRLYRADRNGDAMSALARFRVTVDRQSTEINGLTRRFDESRGPAAANPADGASVCLGDLLGVEYPGASWELMIKGGTQ